MSSISFMRGFKLAVDAEHNTLDLMGDSVDTISCLSSMASSCASALVMLKDGSIPSDEIVCDIGHTASLLSDLVAEVSNHLGELCMQQQKQQHLLSKEA